MPYPVYELEEEAWFLAIFLFFFFFLNGIKIWK